MQSSTTPAVCQPGAVAVGATVIHRKVRHRRRAAWGQGGRALACG